MIKSLLTTLLFVCFIWGFRPHWKPIGYGRNTITYWVSNQRLKGMYFRYKDSLIIDELLAYEKTIPKDKKVFLMPDPLFFYFATGRKSPVPITHFLVSGWELNEKEQAKIPEYLKDVDVVILGKEKTFDTGFLRFEKDLPWHELMMSRSDYSELRWWLERNFPNREELDWFWVLNR